VNAITMLLVALGKLLPYLVAVWFRTAPLSFYFIYTDELSIALNSSLSILLSKFYNLNFIVLFS